MCSLDMLVKKTILLFSGISAHLTKRWSRYWLKRIYLHWSTENYKSESEVQSISNVKLRYHEFEELVLALQWKLPLLICQVWSVFVWAAGVTHAITMKNDRHFMDLIHLQFQQTVAGCKSCMVIIIIIIISFTIVNCAVTSTST